jgi:hypothetical protein
MQIMSLMMLKEKTRTWKYRVNHASIAGAAADIADLHPAAVADLHPVAVAGLHPVATEAAALPPEKVPVAARVPINYVMQPGKASAGQIPH